MIVHVYAQRPGWVKECKLQCNGKLLLLIMGKKQKLVH